MYVCVLHEICHAWDAFCYTRFPGMLFAGNALSPKELFEEFEKRV